MHTVHCVRAVFTALGGVDGIHSADVRRGSALVDHDGSVTTAAMRDAVRAAGYDLESAEDERRSLPVI